MAFREMGKDPIAIVVATFTNPSAVNVPSTGSGGIAAVPIEKIAGEPDITGYTWFSTMTVSSGSQNVIAESANPIALTAAVKNVTGSAITVPANAGTYRFAFFKKL